MVTYNHSEQIEGKLEVTGYGYLFVLVSSLQACKKATVTSKVIPSTHNGSVFTESRIGIFKML